MLVTMGEGGYGAFILFACFCFCMFIFVWFLIPETKGMSLERMDDLFGVTEMVKHLDDEEKAESVADNDQSAKARDHHVEIKES